MRVAVLILLAGCDTLFGLDDTQLAPPDGAPPIDQPPDACTGPQCGQSFTSCKALRDQFAPASGVYSIDAGTGAFPAYCEMAADGGGWTLVMKVDGAQPTFAYDQAVWQDTTTLRTDAPDFDHTEARLESWNAVAFTEIRVVLEFPIGSGTLRSVILPIAGARLVDLFTAAPRTVTALGRDAWKGLIGPTASLQLECNDEGLNVGNAASRMRIGIVSNQEPDCGTPDSRIGIGGADAAQCTFPTTEAAGNSACFTPDNGEVEQVAFGYVLVR